MAAPLTDREYYQLTISIVKALISIESPVKPKHSRAIIIGTFRNEGAHSFWTIISRQRSFDQRVTAWKFCHVLHQILREGHHSCLEHSMYHIKRITAIGNSSACFPAGYGLCIQQYTKLLVVKLNFHQRNPRFPGNLMLNQGEFELIAAANINDSFQLAIEMFDYLDEVLKLQGMVFYTMNQLRLTVESPAGQCRLRPLVFCVQDSSQLYIHCLNLMFLLHKNMSNNVLIGHRERLESIFMQLKEFYTQAYDIPCFEDLRPLLMLPAFVPNLIIF